MSNKTSYDVNDNNITNKDCLTCGEKGVHLITKKTIINGREALSNYYLCTPCLLKIINPVCNDCESKNEDYTLNYDLNKLEVTCNNCGLVLCGIEVQEHKEKRDYKTRQPKEIPNKIIDLKPNFAHFVMEVKPSDVSEYMTDWYGEYIERHNPMKQNPMNLSDDNPIFKRAKKKTRSDIVPEKDRICIHSLGMWPHKNGA
jgi:hypothetical protein